MVGSSHSISRCNGASALALLVVASVGLGAAEAEQPRRLLFDEDRRCVLVAPGGVCSIDGPEAETSPFRVCLLLGRIEVDLGERPGSMVEITAGPLTIASNAGQLLIECPGATAYAAVISGTMLVRFRLSQNAFEPAMLLQARQGLSASSQDGLGEVQQFDRRPLFSDATALAEQVWLDGDDRWEVTPLVVAGPLIVANEPEPSPPAELPCVPIVLVETAVEPAPLLVAATPSPQAAEPAAAPAPAPARTPTQRRAAPELWSWQQRGRKR